MNRKEIELNKYNNKNEQLLSAESNKYMIDIICYLRTKNVDSYEVEVIRGDIISMFLDAQNRKDTIEKVLGDEYKSFCDEILKNMKYKNRRHIICEWADCILSAFLVLVGITFLFSGMCEKTVNHLFYKMEFDWLWGVTSGNLITWLILSIAVFVFLFLATNTSLSDPPKGCIPKRPNLYLVQGSW